MMILNSDIELLNDIDSIINRKSEIIEYNHKAILMNHALLQKARDNEDKVLVNDLKYIGKKQQKAYKRHCEELSFLLTRKMQLIW